jgi:hypothetical protein
MMSESSKQQSASDHPAAATQPEVPRRLRSERGPASGDSSPQRVEFDPSPYIRQLRGRGGGSEYLDVKWRLLWLRKEHPDASIVTELVQYDPQMAIFKATVTLPTGGMATGYGSETASDFPDFIEKAETKAIGRALNALGYGAQFSDAPHPEEPLQGRETGEPSRPSARSEAPPQPEEPAERTTQPVVAARPVATPVPATATPVPATATSDPELADYSWSAFWPWARERGLNGPREIEALIGQPVAGLTPAELRDRIVAAESGR